MARRYDSRARHAPMDFQYEKPDSERIPNPIFALPRTPTRSNSTTPGPSTSFAPTGPAPPQAPWFGSSAAPSSFSFTTPNVWKPPPSFSPQKAFPTNDALMEDIADVSMDTAGSLTPDASPTRKTQATTATNHDDMSLMLANMSPLRKRAYKSRDRDRSSERRTRRRRGMKRREDSGSSDEDDDTGAGRSMELMNGRNLHIPLAPAAGPSHNDVPYILSGYVQFLFNLSLLLGFLYVAILVIMAIQRDVKEKMGEYSSDMLREISHCTKLYLDNKCDPAHRIPHMEATCTEWEQCMNRDPSVVGRTRVMAETVAEVIHGFFGVLSWRTMAFMTVFTLSIIAGVNSLLSLYRTKHAPTPMSMPPGVHMQEYMRHASPVPDSIPWRGQSVPNWGAIRESVPPQTPRKSSRAVDY